MTLTPSEQERLTIFTAAEIARRNLNQRIKLSQPEAVAYVCDELMMGARKGRSVVQLMNYSTTLLTTDEVLPRVAQLIPLLQVEGMFPDGTKMITVHEPICPGRETTRAHSSRRRGEIIPQEGEIELNAGRRRTRVVVENTGDDLFRLAVTFTFSNLTKP